MPAAEAAATSRTALKRYAHQLAEGQRQVTLHSVDRQSLEHLDTQRAILYRAYLIFRQQAQDALLSGEAGEWLLDNYYVVSSALRQIEPLRHY
jgi:hypothetical protein